jgi:hypothetical protein
LEEVGVDRDVLELATSARVPVACAQAQPVARRRFRPPTTSPDLRLRWDLDRHLDDVLERLVALGPGVVQDDADRRTARPTREIHAPGCAAPTSPCTCPSKTTVEITVEIAIVIPRQIERP